MERRDLFRILGAGAVAPVAAQQAPKDWRTRAPRFFSVAEYELLKSAVSIILPDEEEGGGALAAGVPYYIDTTVFYGDATTKGAWRQGLASLGKAGASAPLLSVLEQLAAREQAPSSEQERFFVRLKSLTIQGWAFSDEGARYLGYKGNTAHYSFAGCTHPEHQR